MIIFQRLRQLSQSFMTRLSRSKSLNNKWFYRIVLTLLLAVTSLSVLSAFSFYQLRLATDNLVRDLVNLSEQELSEIGINDLEKLDTSIDDVTTYAQFSRIFTLPIRPFINLNSNWRFMFIQLDIIREIGLASEELLDGIQPAIYYLISAQDSSVAGGVASGARITELLAFGSENFDNADVHLSQAYNHLNLIPLNRLSDRNIVRHIELNALHEQLTTANTALIVGSSFLHVLLGIEDQTNYLILAQNNDEIRPSGGFIGSYGWMRMLNGRVSNFAYNASNETNPNPPNATFANNYEIPEWWIQYRNPEYAAWDGSWHVDFSETAQLAIDYYNAGNNLAAPIEAVIAIDLTGFEILLDALGDVSLPEYGVVVNSEDFRDIIYDIRADGQTVDAHKIFLSDVYQSIQSEWSSIELDALPELLDAMLIALEQKHIMLYFVDTEAQFLVDTLNWGGEQLVSDNYDYLLVADANVSGNKSNNSIHRNISYDVNLFADGSAEQRLAIQYDYLAGIAANDPAVNPTYHGPLLYLNRLQIFTTANSQLVDNNFTQLQTLNADNLVQHVTSIFIEYNTSERFILNFQTNDLVQIHGNLSHYRLLIQKQAGARTQALNVRINLPQDARLVSVSPETGLIHGSDQINLDLLLEQNTDIWIDVYYRNP